MLELTAIDLILVPVYLVLLSFVLSFINKRINKDKTLIRYFSTGSKIKLVVVIFFGLFSIFLSPGDTAVFYTGGLDYKNIVLDKPHFLFSSAQEFGNYYETQGLRAENYGFVSSESNLMAMKFVALFSLVSFNNYMVICMFFSAFSFFGLWFMFKTFYKMYPGLHKVIFMTFFLIPSVLFWGSGVMKDTLCIGFLGIGFYNAYLFFIQKRYDIKFLFACLISFYCLFVLKSYIAIAFGCSFVFWLFLLKIATLNSIAVKAAVTVIPVLLIGLYLVFGNFNKLVSDFSVEALAENMQANQKNYFLTTPDDGAFIDYGEIVPTVGGIARIIPKALVASLFRPFIWESRKITSLIASIEGSFFFVFTLYVFLRKGILRSLKIVFTNSTISFCLLFAIVFAIAIGLNCFNLGTLVRYKIPCLPFYLFSLILILKKHEEKSVAPLKAGSSSQPFVYKMPGQE
ncbi:MAG: hypothetical protein H7Y86_08185 [Rhizobacter sp.]|nr:hypothetical protein [Ferruginibacter sp.]